VMIQVKKLGKLNFDKSLNGLERVLQHGQIKFFEPVCPRMINSIPGTLDLHAYHVALHLPRNY